MKKFTAILCAALLALAVLAGCGGTSRSGSATGKLSVVATIFPPYDFVREIAGDDVELTLLLPPGAESHSFEPTPQDIITIQNCDVFLYAGGESDSWIEDILATIDTEQMTLLPLTDMVDAKEEELVEGMQHSHGDEESHSHEEAHDEHQEHGHSGHEEAHTEEAPLDEHVWTSPKNAIAIVAELAGVLGRLDAAHADSYAQNAERYTEKLQALDAEFEQVVAGAKRHTLVFGDRFPFRYFADAYGLEYYAAFPGCSTDAEPSAATIAFLIDKVKTEQIPVVFHIEMSNEKMADTICGDTGAEKRMLHSCHNVTKAELEAGAGYLSLMEQNVGVLREALQ